MSRTDIELTTFRLETDMNSYSLNRRQFLQLSAAASLSASTIGGRLWAQERIDDFPSKPIRIVVPYTPGGVSDQIARAFGAGMQQAWGQPVIVDNRPGAATNIGNSAVAKAKADGYTLLLSTPTLSSNGALFSGKLGYDPVKDFTGVSCLVRNPNAMLVPAGSPFKTVADVIAWGKAHPGDLTYGHPGTGAIPHLAAELFAVTAGLQMTPVPYKGTAPVMADLLGGQLPLAFDNFPGYLQHVRSGKVRALAILGSERLSVAPQIPSMADAGFKDFDGTGWSGISAPAGTPRPIIDKLSAELQRIAKLPRVRSQFETTGFTLVGNSPAEFDRWLDSELKRWSNLILTRNIRLE